MTTCLYIYRLMTSALSWSWLRGLPPSTPPLMPMTSTWSEQATAVASFIGFFLPPALIGHSRGNFIVKMTHNPNTQGLPNCFFHDLCALARWLLLDNSRHNVKQLHRSNCPSVCWHVWIPSHPWSVLSKSKSQSIVQNNRDQRRNDCLRWQMPWPSILGRWCLCYCCSKVSCHNIYFNVILNIVRTDFLIAQAMGYAGTQIPDSDGVEITSNFVEYSYLDGR